MLSIEHFSLISNIFIRNHNDICIQNLCKDIILSLWKLKYNSRRTLSIIGCGWPLNQWIISNRRFENQFSHFEWDITLLYSLWHRSRRWRRHSAPAAISHGLIIYRCSYFNYTTISISHKIKWKYLKFIDFLRGRAKIKCPLIELCWPI